MKRLWLATFVAWLTLSSAQQLSLEDRVAALETKVQMSEDQPLLVIWVMVGALFAIIMQAPYLLLEMSMPAEPEHQIHPAARNVFLAGQMGLWWYILGWALAYGDGNPFLGTSNFVLVNFPGSSGWTYAHFILGWAIACLVAAITSAVMSTRATLRTHFLVWFFITVWIQAIPAHWIWSHTGWLSPNSTSWNLGWNGMLDWGGAAALHCVAATTALVASAFLGPRRAALGPDVLAECRAAQDAQNPTHLWAAHFLIVICLLCLNSVPGLFYRVDAMYAHRWTAVPRAMALTFIGAFTGPWLLWVWTWGWNRRKLPASYSISNRLIMHTILVSMISVSGGGAFMEPWAAIPVGFIGVACFYGLSWTLDRVGLDDPHSLIALHGAGGFWGCIATGVFASEGALEEALGLRTGRYGWIMWGGLEQMAIQILGAVVTVAWAALFMVLLLWILQWWRVLRPGGKMANHWKRRRRSSSREPIQDTDPEAPVPVGVNMGTRASTTSVGNFNFGEAPRGSFSLAPEDQLPAPISVESTVQRSGAAAPQYMSGFMEYETQASREIPDGGWNYN